MSKVKSVEANIADIETRITHAEVCRRGIVECLAVVDAAADAIRARYNETTEVIARLSAELSQARSEWLETNKKAGG